MSRGTQKVAEPQKTMQQEYNDLRYNVAHLLDDRRGIRTLSGYAIISTERLISHLKGQGGGEEVQKALKNLEGIRDELLSISRGEFVPDRLYLLGEGKKTGLVDDIPALSFPEEKKSPPIAAAPKSEFVPRAAEKKAEPEKKIQPSVAPVQKPAAPVAKAKEIRVRDLKNAAKELAALKDGEKIRKAAVELRKSIETVYAKEDSMPKKAVAAVNALDLLSSGEYVESNRASLQKKVSESLSSLSESGEEIYSSQAMIDRWAAKQKAQTPPPAPPAAVQQPVVAVPKEPQAVEGAKRRLPDLSGAQKEMWPLHYFPEIVPFVSKFMTQGSSLAIADMVPDSEGKALRVLTPEIANSKVEQALDAMALMDGWGVAKEWRDLMKKRELRLDETQLAMLLSYIGIAVARGDRIAQETFSQFKTVEPLQNGGTIEQPWRIGEARYYIYHREGGKPVSMVASDIMRSGKVAPSIKTKTSEKYWTNVFAEAVESTRDLKIGTLQPSWKGVLVGSAPKQEAPARRAESPVPPAARETEKPQERPRIPSFNKVPEEARRMGRTLSYREFEEQNIVPRRFERREYLAPKEEPQVAAKPEVEVKRDFDAAMKKLNTAIDEAVLLSDAVSKSGMRDAYNEGEDLYYELRDARVVADFRSKNAAKPSRGDVEKLVDAEADLRAKMAPLEKKLSSATMARTTAAPESTMVAPAAAIQPSDSLATSTVVVENSGGVAVPASELEAKVSIFSGGYSTGIAWFDKLGEERVLQELDLGPQRDKILAVYSQHVIDNKAYYEKNKGRITAQSVAASLESQKARLEIGN